MSKTQWSGYQSPDLEPDEAGKDAVANEIVRPGLREESREHCASCVKSGLGYEQPCWGAGLVCQEEARERAQVEAERMEIYEGGPLPDANYFDHDQD